MRTLAVVVFASVRFPLPIFSGSESFRHLPNNSTYFFFISGDRNVRRVIWLLFWLVTLVATLLLLLGGPDMQAFKASPESVMHRIIRLAGFHRWTPNLDFLTATDH